MDTLLPFALLCFTSFFTLTNPLGTMPVFLTMTHGMTDKERQAVVRRATFVSFITLMVFVFAGQFLFNLFVFQFHWSIPGLQHIKTNLKNDNPTCNTEPIGRNTKELKKELSGKNKYH